jgi:hypothetical protein
MPPREGYGYSDEIPRLRIYWHMGAFGAIISTKGTNRSPKQPYRCVKTSRAFSSASTAYPQCFLMIAGGSSRMSPRRAVSFSVRAMILGRAVGAMPSPSGSKSFIDTRSRATSSISRRFISWGKQRATNRSNTVRRLPVVLMVSKTVQITSEDVSFFSFHNELGIQ